MNEAIELKITTWVSSAADTAIAPQPGKRLHTRINLVDGDIENEIGDRFIGTGAYKELRQFHCEQVALANQTIQGNLESLQQLFAVLLAWQRSNLNLDQGNIEISDLEMRLLASGAAIEEVAPITEVDFVDLADSPELSSDLTSTELVSEISDAEEEEEEDWEDDDDITDFFASLPLDEEEETKLSSDEIEADLNREELSASLSRTEASLDQQSDLDKQTNLAAPTPEMPVSDLEIEDWEESVPVYSPPETSEVSPARDSTTSTDSESLVASEEKPLFAQDTPTTAEESEIGDRDLEDWGSFLEAELSETEAESEQLSTQTVVSSPVSTTDWEDSDLFDEELSPQETAAEIASWNLREAEDRPLRETDLATETLAEVEAGDELLSDESTDSTATNFASWELEEEATSTTSDLDFDAETALFAEDSVTESDLQSEELNEETTTTFSAPENLTEDPQVGVSEEDDWLDLEQETDSPDAENTDLFDSEN
ncbi:MAG: hypothetical protein SAK42_02900, partial [Oscillatoria sp. PMC 1076.18]|nr:hypothetical protein [Oscillatoria sp. PMC 1076.18]